MKQSVKKFTIFALSILCIFSIHSTVFATGAAVEESHLIFHLTDLTNGIFIDDVIITLKGLETDIEYNYTITSAHYLFGLEVGGTAIPGDYNISLNFASKDQFTVQNTDSTPITAVSLEGAEHTFDWVVIHNTENITETAESSMQETSEITVSNYTANTGNTEADELWNTFLLAVAPVATDREYATILDVSENMKFSYAWNEVYEKATGESKDNFVNMPPFEKFLWLSTYMEPYNAITSGSYQTYCSSLTKWFNYGLMSSYGMIKNHGSAEMLTAYETLMEWQYNHFLASGSVYNFMTGKTAPEENSNLVNTESNDLTDAEIEEIEDTLEGELSNEEIVEITSALENELKQEQSPQHSDKDTGFNLWLFLPPGIFLGTAIGAIIFHRRKNNSY